MSELFSHFFSVGDQFSANLDGRSQVGSFVLLQCCCHNPTGNNNPCSFEQLKSVHKGLVQTLHDTWKFLKNWRAKQTLVDDLLHILLMLHLFLESTLNSDIFFFPLNALCSCNLEIPTALISPDNSSSSYFLLYCIYLEMIASRGGISAETRYSGTFVQKSSGLCPVMHDLSISSLP